jgi:hypothetical protein
MRSEFIRCGAGPERAAAVRALAMVLCPDVFTLTEEWQAAMAEADQLLKTTATPRERGQVRRERIAELRAELAALEQQGEQHGQGEGEDTDVGGRAG